MNYLDILGFFGAFLTGVIIGLFGGGGSILAVPIFVYLFKLNPVIATSYSMFVVGTSAAVGTLININKKLIAYKTALVFTLPALVSVYMTRRFLIPTFQTSFFLLRILTSLKRWFLCCFLVLS